MMFDSKNPDYEMAVRDSFNAQSFMTTLGAAIESVNPGKVVIGFEKTDALLQQHGFLHAGVGTSIVDSACGYAALSLAPAGAEVLTSEFKIHFLRPADGLGYRATGIVLKPGRTLTICEGVIHCDDQPQPIAKMTATMVLRQP